MKIIVTGGGTGGHIYPALALAGGFRSALPDVELLYVGAKDGMEKELASRAGYDFEGVDVAPLARSSWANLKKGIRINRQGLQEAKRIMRRFQPDLVCGTGGYVCGPVVLAAHRLHIPTMIHEQNAVPGIANKSLSLFCDLICLTFPQAASHLAHKKRQILTGLPVRQEILTVTKAQGVAAYQLQPEKKTLLVTGGSQGARKLNQTMAPLWRRFLDAGVQIIHITGPKLYEETCAMAQEQGVKEHPNLRLLPYAHNMEYALAAADVVLGRAGASFLAEVMVLGLPSVLVPYPYAAGNHQVANGQAMAKSGAAVMILEKQFDAGSLDQALRPILEDDKKRQEMAICARAMGNRDALDHIVQAALQIAGKS